MIPEYNIYMYPFMPRIPNILDEPPTLYAVLNSIVNGGKEPEDYSKIKNLALEGRTTIFDFDYPLTEKVSRETFEVTILNHYLMRRIGFETVTAFRIALSAKLNEIMPLYNKMFDALDNWNIFNDGEKYERDLTENKKSDNVSENTLTNTSNTSSENISDRRNSELPQDEIDNVKNASYLTNYSLDTNTANSEDKSNSKGNATSATNDDTVLHETINKSPSDKIAIMKEMQENIKSIYTLIFKELNCLFYGLV